MPKKTTGRAIVPAKRKTSTIPERFAIGPTEIRPLQLHHNPQRHPLGFGPWADEPDKLAWIDPQTGYSCIILRQISGVLGGYVAVSIGHPLWGFAYDAVPADLDLSPHRGLDYAAHCQEDQPEPISICHGRDRLVKRSAPDRLEEGQQDEVWWFGFGCDKPGDLVPNGGKPPLHREEGETYRGIDYVFEETCSLARSLRAIEDGIALPNSPSLALRRSATTPDKA